MVPRIIAAGCVFAGSLATAATIRVPADQPTIKAAVGAASVGDTIVVAPGVYVESVSIKKKLDDISMVGVADSATGAFPEIVCPGKGNDGVRVKASGFAISDVRISTCNNGVRFDYAPGGVATRVAVSGSRTGFNVRNSPGVRVSHGSVADTTGAQGIVAAYAPELVLDGNVIANPYREGIRVANAPGAQITGNTVQNASRTDGIRLDRVAGGTVSGNAVTGSKNDGLRIANAPHVTLTANTASTNRHIGIRVDRCPPIASVGDVLGAGNVASGNGAADVRVYR